MKGATSELRIQPHYDWAMQQGQAKTVKAEALIYLDRIRIALEKVDTDTYCKTFAYLKCASEVMQYGKTGDFDSHYGWAKEAGLTKRINAMNVEMLDPMTKWMKE